MHALEVWVGNVGVDLRGGNIAMAEHGLYAAQIGTVHEQIGRK